MRWGAEHPVLLGVMITLAVGFIGAYPLQALLTATVAGCCYLLWRLFVQLDKRSRDTIARRQMLAWDAHYQHWLTINGHPAGTYGRWPPQALIWSSDFKSGSCSRTSARVGTTT